MDMTDKGQLAVDELVRALEDTGFEVTSVGTRYRVTNRSGGRPAFIPGRLPRGAKMGPILKSLALIGFDIDTVEQARAERNAARAAAARAEGDRLLAVAQRAASERAAQVDRVGAPTFSAAEADVADRQVLPRTDYIDMDPTFAEELLRTNNFYDPDAQFAGRCNRKFKIDLARKYRDRMLRGEWDVFTNQSIGIDIDGNLIDGQHRLAALVLAGEVKPDLVIPMPVTYDLQPKAMDKVDIGLGRTMSDILSMHGYADTNNLAAVIRWISNYDSLERDGVPFDARTWNTVSVSHDQALRIAEADPVLAIAVREGLKMRRVCLPSAAGAAWRAIHRHWGLGDGVELATFFDQVRTGASLTEDAVPYKLREAFLSQRDRRNYRRTPLEQMALWIKGWNLRHESGRKAILTWRTGEDFPLVAPPKHTPTSTGARPGPRARQASG